MGAGRASVQRAIAEKQILEQISHPFIVKLHYAFQDASCLFLVLQFLGGGDLFTLIENMPERQLSESAARFYSAEVVLALEHLHSHAVIFRDLKPEV